MPLLRINPLRQELSEDDISFRYVSSNCPKKTKIKKDKVCYHAMPDGSITGTCPLYLGRHPQLNHEFCNYYRKFPQVKAMYKYSKKSLKALNTADRSLVLLFTEVIKVIDCTIVYGWRGQIEQDEMVRKGLSKVNWPDSMHNHKESLAVDAAPYPINWNDRERFVYFAGIVKGIAHQLNIPIRWGGDWDNDNDLLDQTFMDLAHFELIL